MGELKKTFLAGFAVLIILLLAPYYLEWIGYNDVRLSNQEIETEVALPSAETLSPNRPKTQTIQSPFAKNIKNVNENTGLELQWFFDVYLYQNELPVLNVREEKDQNKLFLDIWWENKSFKMPIDISYIGIDGKINRRLSISNAPTRIALIQNNQYELDPDDWVLYKTTQN